MKALLHPARYTTICPALLCFFCTGLAFSPATANATVDRLNPSYMQAEEILQECVISVKRLLADAENTRLRQRLRNAKGIMIFPSILKAGFLIGVEGGRGVMVVKRKNGNFSHPAFFEIGAVSLGAQAGLSDNEALFAIMSERGVISIIQQRVKLGAELSVAIGTFGAGEETATTASLADVYSFSQSNGIFFGISIEGAYIDADTELNQAFYGRGASVAAILGSDKYSNTMAGQLLRLLSSI
ncbi:MAG: lipid-binding SYLF domain-containing protein [Alphaproteobacteria bacterium GM7ARS4]|nr:lipid-binding SYLF domain-containing protein [Alphaproteobacteria bacterium GM7ARS4]